VAVLPRARHEHRPRRRPGERAILGQPAATIDAGLRITEQGEALADKYSHPVLARRNLEQALYGLLLGAARPAAELPARWTDGLTRASRASVTAYRALVEDPRFLGFFEEVDADPRDRPPQDRLTPGPPPRPADAAQPPRDPLGDELDAEPGQPAGLVRPARGAAAIGPELGREMYAQWQFFRSLLDNAQMSLAKTDLSIFAEYLRLSAAARSPTASRRPTPRPSPSSRRPSAARCWWPSPASPQHRAAQPLHRPDPPHPGRAAAPLAGRAERGLDELERPLLLSVQGIAAGVRNTG
jgi:phosphoenolpyruvate carboxylase